MRYGPLSYHRLGRTFPRERLREPFTPADRRAERLRALFEDAEPTTPPAPAPATRSYLILRAGTQRYHVLRISSAGGAATAAANPVATGFFADTTWRTATNPRGWASFFEFTNAVPLAEQQANWRAKALAEVARCCDAAAVLGAKAFHVYDGLGQGQEFPDAIYVGKPKYFPPEVTEQAVRDVIALVNSRGLLSATTIRPTVFDPVAGTQAYGPDSFDTLHDSIADGYDLGHRVFYCDSSRKGIEGTLTGNGDFTHAEFASLAAEFPGSEFILEWWDPAELMDVPSVRIMHHPYPSDYLPGGGGLRPEWDPHAVYRNSGTENLSDPATVAYLSALFGRGCRLMVNSQATFAQPHQQALAQLWRAAYRDPGF